MHNGLVYIVFGIIGVMIIAGLMLSLWLWRARRRRLRRMEVVTPTTGSLLVAAQEDTWVDPPVISEEARLPWDPEPPETAQDEEQEEHSI